jgi:hypothetical protein
MDGDVIFDWQTSRAHHHAANWLGEDFEGVLHSEAYEAYVNYCAAQALRGKEVTRAACLPGAKPNEIDHLLPANWAAAHHDRIPAVPARRAA